MRVLAVGVEDFTVGDFEAAGDPKDLLDRVVLVALVGIVDPPVPRQSRPSSSAPSSARFARAAASTTTS
ncbi:MAG: hypothetical protein LC635_06685 [Pseudonocardiaceae bacterium]|nr:hypothetical protein [Pseudonocardiaceae bacterium]